MENATKALLIAAGMLFAVALIGLLVYMYLNITGYYGAKQNSTTVEQLTEFNRQYEAYNRDDVTGFELVSLINKIINYNANNAYDENLKFYNSDKNFEKMYIKFTLTDSNITNGILNPKKDEYVKLFEENIYDSEASKTNEALKTIMKNMQNLEKQYSASVLSKLVSNKDNLGKYNSSGKDENGKDVKLVLGKQIDEDKLPTIVELLQYEQYIEFKRATFKCIDIDGTTGTEYNEKTGRITKLKFVQK